MPPTLSSAPCSPPASLTPSWSAASTTTAASKPATSTSATSRPITRSRAIQCRSRSSAEGAMADLACPQCKRLLTLPHDDWSGVATCPACHATFDVQSPRVATPPPAPPKDGLSSVQIRAGDPPDQIDVLTGEFACPRCRRRLALRHPGWRGIGTCPGCARVLGTLERSRSLEIIDVTYSDRAAFWYLARNGIASWFVFLGFLWGEKDLWTCLILAVI